MAASMLLWRRTTQTAAHATACGPHRMLTPQTWLADVLARIASHPASRLDELLPWNWIAAKADALAA